MQSKTAFQDGDIIDLREHDDRYEKLYYEKAVEGGSWNMCKIIDDYIKIGEDRGKAEVNERVATDMRPLLQGPVRQSGTAGRVSYCGGSYRNS